MADAVIAGACRTPCGRFLGALAPLSAPLLGAVVVREALRRAGVEPDAVDEVIMGNVVQAGIGQNPARQAAIRGGVPAKAGAMTINKVCGSGLKAVALAAQAIRAGDADCVVAGGMESMSNIPHYARGLRAGKKMGDITLTDGMVFDGLWDAFNDFHMGMTAELVAEKYGITREEQDRFALESHRRAVSAMDEGRFDAEIAAVEVPARRGETVTVAQDETPRRETSLEALAKLRPAFKREGGTVTAGNAPGVNDGASAMVVLSEDRARELGVTPMARITGSAVGGVEPEWVMMAPLEAVRRLGERRGVDVSSYDLVELNEAFSVAAVALVRELRLDPERVNVNGGAVALGHPIGASGARILTTLLHALRARGLKTGMAGLCLGGGNAVALSVERM